MDIESHFIKDNDFKTIQLSGVFGGVMGNGLLNINLFTERLPIPTKIVLDVKEGSQTITEKSRESKNGIIREVHIGVLVDINTAKSIQAFLAQAISQQEALLGTSQNT
jgi:hypothetical protein